MQDQPTLIIVATSAAPTTARPWADTVHDWRHLQALAEAGTHSGLPTLCVLPPHRGAPPVELPNACLLMDAPRDLTRSCLGLAEAVQATACSSGWLVLPANNGNVPRPQVIQAIANALQIHTLVAPMINGTVGLPAGFGTEFYSELTRVQTLHDLEKLMVRYPFALLRDEFESNHSRSL